MKVAELGDGVNENYCSTCSSVGHGVADIGGAVPPSVPVVSSVVGVWGVRRDDGHVGGRLEHGDRDEDAGRSRWGWSACAGT